MKIAILSQITAIYLPNVGFRLKLVKIAKIITTTLTPGWD
jgi:hypothetical protein